jgi:hypothetical protein
MRRIGPAAALAALLPLLLTGCDSPTEIELTPPANVAVRPLSPTMVQVTWDEVAGAATYVVERAEGASGGGWSVVGTPSAALHDDTEVATGGVYRYRVFAVSGSRTSQPSNPTSALTVPDEIRKRVTANITANTTWHPDTVYELSGFIKVANGAVLTILPGTRIVGDFQIPGSSLFVLRGARIVAEGTVDRPIVFTSERPVGQRQPGDWGGIIIIGNGITNRGAPTYIEGTGTGPENPLVDYSGGSDNDDNSGVLRFVRIEFAGFPTAPNEELNSLTMAAVGRGTTIEFVQVLQGLDDSFEWFGGAVDGRYLVSYESADDHFDASEGYVGRNQFLIAFQSIRPQARPGLAGGVASDPQGIENDGCWAENCNAGDNNRSASTPYTVPVFANFTLVGSAPGAWESSSGNYGMMLRRGTGGLYVNGVVTRYSRDAISLRGAQTMARVNEGNMAIRNLYVSQVRAVFQAEDLTSSNLDNRQYVLDLAANAIENGGTTPATSLFTAMPSPTSALTTVAQFDWRPAAGSPIATGGLTDFSTLPPQLQAAAGSFITPTAYRGAASPNGPRWWEGWTSYAHY